MYKYLTQLPGNTQASVGAVKPFPFECHYYKYAPQKLISIHAKSIIR